MRGACTLTGACVEAINETIGKKRTQGNKKTRGRKDNRPLGLIVDEILQQRAPARSRLAWWDRIAGGPLCSH